MKIRDKKIGQTVEVADHNCLKCSCYWPRPDPGSFTQGRGYTSRAGKREWLCGTREVNGCPTRSRCCGRSFAEYATKCSVCGQCLVKTGREES